MLSLMLRVCALLCLGLVPTSLARAAPFQVPVQEAPTPESFVPSGWSTELARDGDLDADGAADRVLVLLQQESPEGERERALVVLLKRQAGYVVGATNRGLVSCYECQGIKGGDARPNVSIQRGVLVIAQLGGSRDWYAATHRFRWRAASGKLELIGLDTSNGDSFTGESSESSTNLLTGKVVLVEQPAQVDAEGRELRPARAKRKQLREKARSLLVLEALDTAF